NLGKAMAPHAVLEVRSGAGELIWRWDRDGKKPVQVITPQVAMDMNMMMSKVVEEGTARRAILDGIKSAGKTGTTNAYRDAWFVGFNGNMVCGVWFGNDDYTTMHQMTGGSLPAQTWHEIMAYAHQGIELKPIPGLGPQQGPSATRVAEAKKDGDAPASRPNSILTKRGADALVRLERLLDDATRALATRGEMTKASDETRAPAQASFASAPKQRPPDRTRGNGRRPAAFATPPVPTATLADQTCVCFSEPCLRWRLRQWPVSARPGWRSREAAPMAASASVHGRVGQRMGPPASIPMPAAWSRAPASCPSVRATGWPSRHAPTMQVRRSPAAARCC